jgi:hypothetical protein
VRDAIVYCLTRDHLLASALDTRLVGPLAFFYNDAARLNQAVMLRTPDLILVDTGAIRAEYGDAGLGPVFDFLRRRAPGARLAVRPSGPASERLVRAEAGSGVELVPRELDGCVDAIAAACGIA